MNQSPPDAASSQKKSGASRIILIILIVLGVMVVVLGILGVLAIVGVKKYIGSAKAAEARNSVGMMARSAVSAWESSDALTEPRPLCPSAHAPIPASLVAVAAKKYQSIQSEWTSDPGFACLSFTLTEPQYYQYDYASTASEFTAKAMGDVDGDGTPSKFTLSGKIAGASIVVAPAIDETNPDE